MLQNKSIINRRDRFNTSYLIPVIFGTFISCLQCFDAVGWAAGRASGLSKKWVVGCWHGYLSGARCRLAYGPAYASDTVSFFSIIQIGFAFLVPAYQGAPGKRAVKWVCMWRVCVISDECAINRWFNFPPYLSSVSTLLWETKGRENHEFLLKNIGQQLLKLSLKVGWYAVFAAVYSY